MNKRRLAAAAGAACLITAVAAGPASADPKRGDEVMLTCGSTTYDVVVAGNGEFTPAHDTASTKVFIPVDFGAGAFSVTNLETGAVLYSETDPDGPAKGSGQRTGQSTQECTFQASMVSYDDPDFGGQDVMFTFSGVVYVKA